MSWATDPPAGTAMPVTTLGPNPIIRARSETGPAGDPLEEVAAVHRGHHALVGADHLDRGAGDRGALLAFDHPADDAADALRREDGGDAARENEQQAEPERSIEWSSWQGVGVSHEGRAVPCRLGHGNATGPSRALAGRCRALPVTRLLQSNACFVTEAGLLRRVRRTWGDTFGTKGRTCVRWLAGS